MRSTIRELTVVNGDAMIWLDRAAAEPSQAFDAAIVDFPDPSTFALGKLYTTRFYRLLRAALAPARDRGRAMHVAAVCPAIVLVHRAHDRGGGVRGAAISCGGAVVRRLGIRAGAEAAVRDA